MNEPITYEFDTQLNRGKAGEWVMNKYHAREYIVKDVGMKEQRRGIDAVYVSKQSGTIYNVEIKTDFLTVDTENIAIEIVSNTATGKKGWAVTSQSDVIIYYLWDLWIVLYFNTGQLKEEVAALQSKHRIVEAKNNGYETSSILVPLSQATELAFTHRSPVDAYWMKRNYREWIIKSVST